MKKSLLLVLCLAAMGLSFGQNTHWQPEGGFESNMTVEAIVYIDNVEQFSETLELGAFCGEECRGAVLPFEDAGQMWYFLLFGGVNNEQITFRLYDHATSQELGVECENVLTYVSDGDIDPYDVYFTTPSSAITNTTAGNWSDPANWQGGALPDASDAVVIAEDCTLDQNATVASLAINDGAVLTLQTGTILTVTSDLVNAAVDRLVIKDGAQLINASANVKATYEKNIISYNTKSSDGWYTISSPVDNMDIAGSPFVTPNYDLYRFNETRIGGEWENYKDPSNTDFTIFQNGRGYLYANSNTDHYDITGTLNNADVSADVTFTNRTDGLSGFNLIGNPFPHNIYKGSGGAIDHAKLASGYYTLSDEGAWHVHTYNDAIQPGQGILVKTTEATTLNIAKTTSAASAESSSKEASRRMDLKVTGANGDDRAFVYFTEGIGLDKMPNFNEMAPSLCISNERGRYAIAHVNNSCESLDLMFMNKQSGEFTLGVVFEGMNFSYFHLVDLVAGVDIDLLQNPDYSFTATGAENEAHFKLVFRMMTSVDEMTEEAPFAYVGDGQIIVNGTGTLQMVDMTGRIVLSGDSACTISTDGQAPGVYVLRMMNENSVRIQKIVIK